MKPQMPLRHCCQICHPPTQSLTHAAQCFRSFPRPNSVISSTPTDSDDIHINVPNLTNLQHFANLRHFVPSNPPFTRFVAIAIFAIFSTFHTLRHSGLKPIANCQSPLYSTSNYPKGDFPNEPAHRQSRPRPLIDPLLLALKSRRVLVALCVLVVGLLTLAIPDLRPVHSELMTLLITLALAVIGGYSLEDAARAGRETKSAAPDELRDLIKEVLLDVVNDTPLQSESK
jgi:hypothetical protein